MKQTKIQPDEDIGKSISALVDKLAPLLHRLKDIHKLAEAHGQLIK